LCICWLLCVLQVLQAAAANVPDGVLAARAGSKAVTAAIDALQVSLRCPGLQRKHCH
jgi:hypothetical protein